MRHAEALFGDEPKLGAGYQYWLALRGEEFLPRASEIDPLDLPRPIFPNIVLADYIEVPARMRFRIVGQEIIERWGSNFAGKTSDEIFAGSYKHYIEDAFEKCRATGLPIYSESAFRWDAGGVARTRRLMLPFADDALDEVIRCMVIQVWPGDLASGGASYANIVGTNPDRVEHMEAETVWDKDDDERD